MSSEPPSIVGGLDCGHVGPLPPPHSLYPVTLSPRSTTDSTNCLLVMPISLHLVDPLRSKIKFYGHKSLGLILYIRTVNQRIYKMLSASFL